MFIQVHFLLPHLAELLKQGLHQTFEVAYQVASIFAGTRGILDKMQVAAVPKFEVYLHEHLRSHHAAVLETIVATGKLEGATEQELESGCRAAQEAFLKEHPEAAIG